MNSELILYFDEIGKTDLSKVGGKGANLGEMTGAGFPVPYGFCVTTESYRRFIEHNALFSYLKEHISNIEPENINEIGARIREKISHADMPKSISESIRNSIKVVGPENYYAVRSSATAEDLSFASFAGQQDTYLNIKGEQSLIDSIKNCWASLFTDRAILYRMQYKIENEKVDMSVVVQKMVLPDVAGIMFTADPISGHRGILSIDAGYGLGEALVSGLVSPDIYKIRKSSLQIDDKIIADKKLAIMPIQGGGTKTVEISGDKSKSQVMKDSKIIELAELGMEIENHYGCPQDIEWCMQDNRFYIVQSRPITSLFPLPKPFPEDHMLHEYLSFNHIQVMTDPISPLGIDILTNIFTKDVRARRKSENKLLPSAAGRIYIDITNVLRLKKIRKKVVSYVRNMDPIIAEALSELLTRPELEEDTAREKIRKWKFHKLIIPVMIRVFNNLVFRNPEGTVQYLNHFIAQYETKMVQNMHRDQKRRIDAINEYGYFFEAFLKIMLPKLAPGILSLKLLERMEKKLLGTDCYINTISKGLEGNITTEMGLLSGDLADMIRKSPALIKEFSNENYKTLLSRINNLAGHEEFKKAFDSFMSTYGIRAAGEIDIAKERWIENPEALAKQILATVYSAEDKIHRKKYQALMAEARAAAEEMVTKVRAKHGRIQAAIVKRLIKVMRNCLPAREHHKYLMMRLCMVFKNVLLDEASVFVGKGQLAEEKDIFYLHMQELYRAIENGDCLKELVEERKAEYQHFKKLNAPRVLTSDGEEIKGGFKRDHLPEGAMAGIPVSSGVIEGIAKVITDPSKETLNRGEILVAPYTDPGWTPLFIHASGLIMEVGGQLTHGTVVAREYGIPAVVGITDAVKNIKTGQRIRLDGDVGYVIVIEEKEGV